ncbi:aimless RasGEF-like protein [Naegleria gruberi]|uniref:Aimless RasGEF-like protein n=1 Tax=Naegleria gruberi TaxID=5762 RepID=D2VTE0_NAEGR|nr:aimless RasGEF-like protein [Naegleria gruberi]EFC39846.1 aimless RasGEF-like protein [Naegleria gruberi]|eukprot:XP_002672590.1 aimless RasGEF-like protein [Naegleria gruberi strain NEG-M]
MDYREEAIAKGYLTLNIPLPPNLNSSTSNFTTDSQTLKQFMSETNPKVEKCKPQHQDKLHNHELKRVTKHIQGQVEKSLISQSEVSNPLMDREQWLARALKRNPTALALMERMRPLSKHPSNCTALTQVPSVGGGLRASSSFRKKASSSSGNLTDQNSPRISTNLQRNGSDHNIGGSVNMTLLNSMNESGSRDSVSNLISSTTSISGGSTTNLLKLMDMAGNATDSAGVLNEEGKKSILDYSSILGTVENREVLSREALLQLIYQHFAQRGLYKTIQTMEEETGIRYNGFRSEKNANKDTLVTTLLSLGIKDIEKPYAMPQSDLVDLEADVEIQTSSIYHHFDEDYVDDMKKPLWAEISHAEEDAEYVDGHDLRGATLNKLIEKLTSTSADGKFIQCFLVTYRSFTVPEILLQKLCQRYRVPKSIPESEKVQIQLRTGVIFNKWIEEYFSLDWNENMIRDFIVFIEDFLLKYRKLAKMGEKLKQKLAQKLASRNRETALVFSEQSQAPDVPRNVFSPKLSIWDIKEEELAKQITFMDHNLYRNIEAHELLNCSWSKPKLRHRSKHVLLSSEFFNKLSNWFSCQIITEDSLRERKAKLTKLMKIAVAMFRLNNFNSLMALNSVYSSSGVFRLKYAIGEIDEGTKKDFTDAIAVMSNDSSSKRYRTYIKQEAKPPLNIYLGIYLTDLTMIEDGNPDVIKHPKTQRSLINWKKRQLVANTISEVMQYKNPPYNIQQVHQIQELLKNTFENHEMVEEKKLFEKSLITEPRSVQRKEDLKQ